MSNVYMADQPFVFSFNRTSGLLPGEAGLLNNAHQFFGLQMGADGQISGVLLLPDGRIFIYASGRVGGPQGGTQAGFIPRGPGSGVTRFTVTHIEGHTAATLHRLAADDLAATGVGEAALLLPKPPCGACDPNIPTMLPKESRLFVVDPFSTSVYQSTRGLTLEGPRFARSLPPQSEMVIPGSVPKGGVANLAFFALSVAIWSLKTDEARRLLNQQITAIDLQVRQILLDKIDEIVSIQREAGFAWVIVLIDSYYYSDSAPLGDDNFVRLKLTDVRIARNSDDYQSEPQLILNSEIPSDLPSPTKKYLIVTLDAYSVERSRTRTSRRITLPQEILDLHAFIRDKMQWYDAAVPTAAELRFEDLVKEREGFVRRGDALLKDWCKEALKPPPATYSPPSAAGVNRPSPPPPPRMP